MCGGGKREMCGGGEREMCRGGEREMCRGGEMSVERERCLFLLSMTPSNKTSPDCPAFILPLAFKLPSVLFDVSLSHSLSLCLSLFCSMSLPLCICLSLFSVLTHSRPHTVMEMVVLTGHSLVGRVNILFFGVFQPQRSVFLSVPTSTFCFSECSNLGPASSCPERLSPALLSRGHNPRLCQTHTHTHTLQYSPTGAHTHTPFCLVRLSLRSPCLCKSLRFLLLLVAY